MDGAGRASPQRRHAAPGPSSICLEVIRQGLAVLPFQRAEQPARGVRVTTVRPTASKDSHGVLMGKARAVLST